MGQTLVRLTAIAALVITLWPAQAGRTLPMDNTLTLPHWPAGTPDDVKALASELAAVVKGRNGQVAGPAVSLVFAYVVAELGGVPLKQVVIDVGELARKHGALKPMRPH
jgi:hypothetical protein